MAVSAVSADGGPHGGYGPTSYECASCHKTHTGQDAKLLTVNRGDLCLSCHDGVGASNDVYDGARLSSRLTVRNPGPNGAIPGTSSTSAGALKGGGFMYARINSTGTMAAPFVYNSTVRHFENTSNTPATEATAAELMNMANWVAKPGAALANTDPGLPVSSAHIKGMATGATSATNTLLAKNIIWGSGAISATANAGASWNVTCMDCHDPHGGGTYRILRPLPNPTDPAKNNPVVVPGVTGVTLPDEASPLYTTTQYWDQYENDTFAGATPPFSQALMSQWCTTCHSRYLSTNATMRANSGDAIFKYRHVSDGANTFAAKQGSVFYDAVSPNRYAPTCLQCHVAHGSNAKTDYRGAGSYKYPDGSSGDPDGAGPMSGADSVNLKIDQRGTCVACHGGIGTPPST
jgi:predicted CXXCH cytochrome family protein